MLCRVERDKLYVQARDSPLSAGTESVFGRGVHRRWDNSFVFPTGRVFILHIPFAVPCTPYLISKCIRRVRQRTRTKFAPTIRVPAMRYTLSLPYQIRYTIEQYLEMYMQTPCSYLAGNRAYFRHRRRLRDCILVLSCGRQTMHSPVGVM